MINLVTAITKDGMTVENNLFNYAYVNHRPIVTRSKSNEQIRFCYMTDVEIKEYSENPSSIDKSLEYFILVDINLNQLRPELEVHLFHLGGGFYLFYFVDDETDHKTQEVE